MTIQQHKQNEVAKRVADAVSKAHGAIMALNYAANDAQMYACITDCETASKDAASVAAEAHECGAWEAAKNAFQIACDAGKAASDAYDEFAEGDA